MALVLRGGRLYQAPMSVFRNGTTPAFNDPSKEEAVSCEGHHLSKYAAKKAAERIATNDASAQPVVLKCTRCGGWNVSDLSDARYFINALVEGLPSKNPKT
jgi:hypothetical protein